jgi:hypothetical protein
LEQQGVSSNVIENFARSLRESDLQVLQNRDKVHGASVARDDRLATPSQAHSLSPIHRVLPSSSSSPNASASPNTLRNSRESKERRDCFDVAPGGINYEWVASQSAERNALVQKLLRSPRPPTSDDKRRAARASESNFDAFSEHDPRVKGLKQLYIPPPSPKVSRQIDSTAILSAGYVEAFEPGLANASSSNAPAHLAKSPAARIVHRNIPFLLDSDRFDNFPDQERAGTKH